jgi:hypothetical protein
MDKVEGYRKYLPGFREDVSVIVLDLARAIADITHE